MLLPGIPHQAPAATATARATRRDAPALRLRSALLLGVVVAVGAGFVLGDPGPRIAADPELATLLRGMAGIKALLLAGAVALLAWRLGKPVAPAFVAIYCVGAAAMAFATALIWQLTALPLATIVFHFAEVGVLVAAWRDLR